MTMENKKETEQEKWNKLTFQDNKMPDANSHCVSSSSSVMADRLASLLPELEYSRGTHIQWRDAPKKWHEENPDIGDRDHHIECIGCYDNRIQTIKDAEKMLRSF